MLPRPGLPGFDYVRASGRQEVTRLLAEHGEAARLLMGGTDLLVRMRDGLLHPRLVVDVKHLPGMRDIHYDPEKGLTIGAAVTMNDIAGHPDVRAHYAPLADAAQVVASYQLRNRATLGGNLANASPAADTAPAVLVLEGRIALHGPEGERLVPAGQFFRGPGQTAMQAGEFITAVHFSPPIFASASRYLKLGRTRAGDLALVGVAVYAFPTAEAPSGYCFRIALGAVAPVPLRALEAEEILAGNPPGEDTLILAAERAAAAASPIDDVRASAAYRRAMVRSLTLRGLREVGAVVAALGNPLASAVHAWGRRATARPPVPGDAPDLAPPLAGRSFALTVTVNGTQERLEVPANMTLLQMLREKLALTGTKNGCAAGECGACTVLLDGRAVNACMVLAVEADRTEIVTVEGLAGDPLQQAFIDEGAVQCGFCTPGMLVSARALLDRHPHPGVQEIGQALVGNLCRCTGYGRIVRAILRAAGGPAPAGRDWRKE